MPTAVQAHRGSPDRSAGILENTVEAFLRARRLGADSVELDVRATADGSLAVHHDPEQAEALLAEIAQRAKDAENELQRARREADARPR